MDDAKANLTGRWFGRYEAPGLFTEEPVPFEVEMIDEGGALSGTVSEPNSFRDDMGPTLTAIIVGSRNGHEVDMRKTYHGFEQDDPIYEGMLNEAFSRITGSFYFEVIPVGRGRFVMVRAVAAKARRAVAVSLELGTTD